MLTIVNGVTSKQVLANEIINLLETMGLDGYFYLGYPVLGGIDGKIKVDALLVSEQTGIVLFDLETLAEENMEDKIQLLDELYNNMEAKLKRYGYLSKRRVLQVPINVLLTLLNVCIIREISLSKSIHPSFPFCSLLLYTSEKYLIHALSLHKSLNS